MEYSKRCEKCGNTWAWHRHYSSIACQECEQKALDALIVLALRFDEKDWEELPDRLKNAAETTKMPPGE